MMALDKELLCFCVVPAARVWGVTCDTDCRYVQQFRAVVAAHQFRSSNLSQVGEVFLSKAGVCFQPPLWGLNLARFQPHVRITPRHLSERVPFKEPCKTQGQEEVVVHADTASLAGLVWKHQVTFLKF